MLHMDEEADQALQQLDADPLQQVLAERVNAALDHLEDEPGAEDNRRHRFTNGLWCILVSHRDETWVILWEPYPPDRGDVIVQYLGRDRFMP